MPDDKNKISVNNVTFTYGSDSGEEETIAMPAVENLSLEIEKGSYTAILGANGSGKSTLAKLIDVLEIPDSGRILVFGKDTSDDSMFWQIREHSACVFQNPDNQIVGTIVEEDVAFGPENLGIPNPELRERVDRALKDVGIYEFRLREASSLSGGQKQKLAIAGALAMRPDILILDEATAMLDPKSRDEFLKVAEQMRLEKNLTLITITHDMSEAMRCEKIIVINRGRKVMEGCPHEIFSSDQIENYGLRRPMIVKFAYEAAKITGINITADEIKDEKSLTNCLCQAFVDYSKRSDKDEEQTSEVPADSDNKAPGRKVMSIKNLSCSYDGNKTYALKDVSLDAYEGEILGIVGASGCGKTTLISHINALIRPSEGEVELYTEDGRTLRTSSKKDTKEIRQTAGLVFQYPEYQLFEETVYKDISYGLKQMNLSVQEQKERVMEAAKAVGLEQETLNKSPFELSGGQKRRAAMAGVISMRPRILVLDEPASGLDPVGREDMFRLIRNLKKNGTTVVLVSHNMDEAAANCDRICCIKNGEAVLVGTPKEIFADADKASELGIDMPKLAKFTAHLKTELSKKVKGAVFDAPEFDPEAEAWAVARAVRIGGASC